MQAGAGHKTRNNVIEHNAQAAMHLPIQGTDGPGLEYIEQTEQAETRKQCPGRQGHSL